MAKDLIRACPICGSTKLEWAGGGADAVFDLIGRTALSGFMECGNCGEQILPVEFESKDEYLKFLKELGQYERKEEKARAAMKTTGLAENKGTASLAVKTGAWLVFGGLFAAMLLLLLMILFPVLYSPLLSALALIFLLLAILGHVILYFSALFTLVMPSKKKFVVKVAWALFLLLPIALEFYYILGYKTRQRGE